VIKKPLKCFLLTAGRGERLRPLTETTPKCLLPINGKLLLSIWLEHLKRHGIDEVLINTHWLHEKVESFLATRQNERPRIVQFYEPSLLGSAGTLLANRHWVNGDQPFFIIYGDNLTNVDLTRMLAYHRGHGMTFTLGVFKTDRPKECGIAEISEDGVVTGFVEKPENPATDLAAAGIYIADSRIFKFFPEKKPAVERLLPQPLDFGFHIIPKLVGHIKAYLIREILIDIGTPEAYKKAQEVWKKQAW
jgi:mannose-1-phosphate guanylyltransferase